MSARARRPEVEELVAAYRADLVSAGMFADHPVTSPARSFLLEVGIKGWDKLSLAEQCATSLTRRRVVGWLMVTGRLRPSPDYLVIGRPYLGEIAARHHREFHDVFASVASKLGYDAKSVTLQWSATVKVAVLSGLAPDHLTKADMNAGREALVAAVRRHRPGSHAVMALTKAFFGAEIILFHAGVLDTAPKKFYPDKAAARAGQWAEVAPRLSGTLQGYIDQMALSLRASTMVHLEAVLREFATWLTREAPEVRAVADLRRSHIEAYKLYLGGRPSARGGGSLTKITLAEHFGTLRSCLERLAEWGGEDVPASVLVFAGDIPIRDQPLPRFIDDGAATKLLQAARADPDPFTRLAVEFLARTGMRLSEFVDLKIDAVVQIGSAYWLHVPIGKLRSDRYIPLHPQLKALIDEWVAARPDILRSDYLFVERGRRISKKRVLRDLGRVARAAGIDHVTPHQLRHTLATQAINRGMSLEAIAALLGHRSMRMTLVYARIADRTVADEYFSVSEKVEALYDKAKELPADAEGAEMAKLRREMHQRMLGNGYCARPVELDCHFESICESCCYFVTTVEFRPTLQRQRDDAAAKGQVGRQKVFDGLLARLDTEAS